MNPSRTVARLETFVVLVTAAVAMVLGANALGWWDLDLPNGVTLTLALGNSALWAVYWIVRARARRAR